MKIIDSCFLCGLDDDTKDAENTEIERSQEIFEDNEDSLVEALSTIRDSMISEVADDPNTPSCVLRFNKPNPLPLKKKRPTISQVKLQILAKQNPDMNLDENKVLDLLDKLKKASKGKTKDPTFNKIVRIATTYVLPLTMLLAGVSVLITVFSLQHSNTITSQAVAAYKNGNLAAAQKGFAKAIYINPANSTAHFYLGCMQQKKDANKAYEHMRTALEISPRDIAILNRTGTLALELELYSDAKKAYNKLISLGQKSTSNYFKRATASQKLGEFEEALNDYTVVLKQKPGNKNAILGTAFCCIQKNEIQAAEYVLSEYLKTDQSSVEARILHGICLKRQKKYDEAYKDFMWVSKNAPGNIDGRLHLAELLIETNKIEPAKVELKAILKQHPNSWEAQNAFASCYLKEKKFSKALALYQKLNSHPQRKETFMTLSNLLEAAIETNNNEIALTSLSKMIALKPQLMPLYLERAKINAALNMLPQALRDCNTAISLKPGHAPAYIQRAKYHTMLDNNISAYNDYAKALELNPDSQEANLAIAKHYLDKEKFVSAIECYEKVLKSDKNNKEAKEGLQSAKGVLASMTGNASKVTTQKAPQLTKAELFELNSSTLEELSINGYDAMLNGRIAYATEALERAVMKEPDNVKTRRFLAHCYLAKSMPRAADVQFKVVQSLGGTLDKKDFQTLAKSYLSNGMPAKAISMLSIYAKNNPADIDALLDLSEAYAQNGEHDKAIKVCSQALASAKTSDARAKLTSAIEALKTSQIEQQPNIQNTENYIPVDTRS